MKISNYIFADFSITPIRFRQFYQHYGNIFGISNLHTFLLVDNLINIRLNIAKF